MIAVQASGAPAAYQSRKTGELVALPTVGTIAEGVATREMASLPAAIMRRYLDDFVLVSDADLQRSILTLLETTRMLAEGAGAAALAAVAGMRDHLAGKTVAIVLSGGNFTLGGLKDALALEQPW